MHEDDTLSRFEHSEPFTGRIEPLDEYVLVEPVDDETETNAGLIIPASAESACIAGIVVAAGDDAVGIAPGDKVLYPRGAGFEIRIGGQPKRLARPARADRQAVRLATRCERVAAFRAQTPEATRSVGRLARLSSRVSPGDRPARAAAASRPSSAASRRSSPIVRRSAQQPCRHLGQHLAERPALVLGDPPGAVVRRAPPRRPTARPSMPASLLTRTPPR